MMNVRPLIHLVDSPVALRLLREEILTCKRTYKAVAAQAQLSPTTVSNIAIGHTRWPHLETTIRILSALGWRIVAQKEL